MMDLEQSRNEQEQKKLTECISYFNERKVYKKLFLKVREKYISLGHFGGSVQLYGLDQEERKQLGGFFQKDFLRTKSVTVSAAAMEKALANSRFAGLKWEDILRCYFGEELVGKKEQKMQESLQREQFFAQIIESEPQNPGSAWLKNILQKQGDGYLLLMKQYREHSGYLLENLKMLMHAIPKLPFLTAEDGKLSYELLAVFAAETTGNPHFFDAGALGEQLLILFLKAHIKNYVGLTSFRSEEKALLFFKAGLLKDDLSNNTLAYGISGIDKEGVQHNGMAGFLERREPVLLTLMTLGKLKLVKPQIGKYVYIVENPAVFSKLITTCPQKSVLCGNGQIRLATLVLMDLFHEETQFYYAGDFDPEGLQIAQKLKERYGDRLKFWRYSGELYERYQSNVEISEERLKKLEKIHVEELQDIKQAMLRQKKATYQEAMLKEYLRD